MTELKREKGRKIFKKFKKVLFFLSLFFRVFGKKVNYNLLILFRNTSGKKGLLIRYIILSNLAKKIGDNISIHPGVYLYNIHNLTLGNNVSIHPLCYIDAYGEIMIGNDVSIAHNSSIITVNHTWGNKKIPIKYNLETFDSVIIEDDVWIGCGVRILAGVNIKKRSIIAAGAVVTTSFESHSIIGGVPAKKIKSIDDEETN